MQQAHNSLIVCAYKLIDWHYRHCLMKSWVTLFNFISVILHLMKWCSLVEMLYPKLEWLSWNIYFYTDLPKQQLQKPYHDTLSFHTKCLEHLVWNYYVFWGGCSSCNQWLVCPEDWSILFMLYLIYLYWRQLFKESMEKILAMFFRM